MIQLAELPHETLRAQLAGPGLNLRTGPFVNRVRSPLPDLVKGLRLVYADYTVSDPNDYADFHVALTCPSRLRRWIHPQAQFYFDGFPPFKPLPLAQAFPMLEWGLNWCVGNHCHQYLILHAAVLEKHGRALILPGAPGAGKSTLCAGLVYRGGWRLLSDELTLLRPGDGYVQPLPRPVSLKNASIEVIRAFAPGVVITPPAHDTSKGTVAHVRAPTTSVLRDRELVLPAWVVFPRYQNGAATRLERFPRGQAFLRLAELAFNYSLLGPSGFETLSRLMDTCESYTFEYSRLEEALAPFDGLAPTETPA